ncbi:thioredoxin family protein [Stieleria tagensis]|uniref:thioredoxin family protein n=1 Tax=Stieleria tagensis TaxID=2956795 RepID=UPI00209AD6F2|nr:thioredoxin family protein [Stieleria tagensis]
MVLLANLQIQLVAGQDAPADPDQTAASDDVQDGAVAIESSSVWNHTLDDAITAAGEADQPIFVIVGAPWCVFCKKMEQEFDQNAVDAIAKHWVLAKIDADDQAADARELRASGLPSLRLLSQDGIIAFSHDGYMDQKSLQQWLGENIDAVKHNVPKLLAMSPTEFSDEQVDELIGFLATRDVTSRRIIIDRLSKIPQRCAPQTVQLLASERLANQLSALQLLKRWQAPVEGLDPWIPGSIDAKTIAELTQWQQTTFAK